MTIATLEKKLKPREGPIDNELLRTLKDSCGLTGGICWMCR